MAVELGNIGQLGQPSARGNEEEEVLAAQDEIQMEAGPPTHEKAG